MVRTDFIVLLVQALGDLVESYIGALFLDTGLKLDSVWEIMLSLLDPIIDIAKLRLDPLRELRELCQFYHWKLQFPSSKKDGKYSVEARVNGNDVSATACATSFSKKTAKRMASQQVVAHLKVIFLILKNYIICF